MLLFLLVGKSTLQQPSSFMASRQLIPKQLRLFQNGPGSLLLFVKRVAVLSEKALYHDPESGPGAFPQRSSSRAFVS